MLDDDTAGRGTSPFNRPLSYDEYYDKLYGSAPSGLPKEELRPRRERTAAAAKTFDPSLFRVTKADGLDYTVGDRVRHIKFGEGTVQNIIDGKRDYEVTVEFDSAGVKKMYAAFAKLQKI